MKCKYVCVVLCVSLIVQCLAMSISELEDFANYLKKTSQLDETLTKGTDSHTFDEDETVSDDAWEESGKFEGDLILNDRQRRMIVEDIVEGLSRNGLRDSTKRWPDNEVIYYIQREHFTEDQVDAIKSGIDDLGRASCIKFRPYKKGDRDAVVIQGSRRGCFSQVGYQGGYQVLNLSGRHPVGRGCFRHGTVVHELLHTLGFYHMQSSPDRDEFVNIAWENIVQPARHNFRKYNAFAVSDFGVGYDYDSVLHYSKRAFSSNGQATIVPKQSGAQIGQRTGLSDKDSQKLNKMYCDADNNNNEELTVKKTPIKKNTPKNKPFEGHGIGYHQGKTMVIKLLPEEKAETFTLDSDPEFHFFDYFRKAPKILQAEKAEGGKSIGDLYKPHFTDAYLIENGIAKGSIKGLAQESVLQLQNDKVDPVNIKNKEAVKNSAGDEVLYTKSDEFIENIFDRLSKILKAHVYPSQTPDFKVYEEKPNNVEELSYNSESDTLHEPIVTNNKTNKDESYLNETNSDTLSSKEKLYNKEEISKVSLKNINIESSSPKSHISNEDESVYRTSYPFKLHRHISNGSLLLKTPEYAKYKNLKQINDYSTLYKPYSEKRKLGEGKTYQIFGDSVPTYNEWYRNEKHRHNPADYDRKFYEPDENEALDPVNIKFEEKSYPDTNYHYTGSYSPKTKQPYKTFGVSVPLTKDWYQQS